MTPKIVPRFLVLNIVKSTRVVHGSEEQKFSRVVKIQGPDRLGIILDGPGTLDFVEIPELDLAVSRGGSQVGSLGTEGDVGDPI